MSDRISFVGQWNNIFGRCESEKSIIAAIEK